MRFLSVVLIVIPLLYLIYRLFSKGDILNPLTFYSAFFALKIVIPTIMFSNEAITNGLLRGDSFLRNSVLDNSIFLAHSLLQTICFFITILGITTSLSSNKVVHVVVAGHRPTSLLQDNERLDNFKIVGIILLAFGTIAFFIMMRTVGGLAYFLSNLQLRTYLIGNLDFLYWVVSLLGNAPILIAYYYFKKFPNSGLRQTIVIIVCMIAGLMSGLGGRSSLVALLIQIMIIYHYTVRPISFKKIFSIKYLLVVILLVAFIVVMPALRSPGEWDTFLHQPGSYLASHFNGVFQLVARESYVPHYTAVMKYFYDHNYWLGSSFKGLLTGFIPSSLYPAKPPVDDGMYLYSICLGRNDIVPTMPASSLNLSSYPLETFGSMYANFGLFGLVIGFFILGKVIGRSYLKMKQAEGNRLFRIVIYTTIVSSFQLSTLRIEQFIISYIKWFVIFFVLNSMRIKTSKEAN